MKTGKLKESILKRSVLKQLHSRRDNLLVGSGIGRDYGAVAVNEDMAVVLASDPITLTKDRIGSSAIIAACNDVACSGAQLQGVSVTVLLPTTSNEEELRALM